MRAPEPGDWMVFHDFMMSDRADAFGSNGDLGKTWRAFASELGHWQIYGYGMWAVTLRGDSSIVGRVGELHPRLLEACDVRADHVVFAEIDLDAFQRLVPSRLRVGKLEHL